MGILDFRQHMSYSSLCHAFPMHLSIIFDKKALSKYSDRKNFRYIILKKV